MNDIEKRLTQAWNTATKGSGPVNITIWAGQAVWDDFNARAEPGLVKTPVGCVKSRMRLDTWLAPLDFVLEKW